MPLPGRRTAAGVAALLAASALSVAPQAAAAPADGMPACAVPDGDGWTSTPAPDLSAFATGSFRDSDQVVAHALDPSSPADRWVASSAGVVRSRDGGCTWEEAVALPEVPTADIPWSRHVHRLNRLVAGRTLRGEQRVVAQGLAFTGEHVLLRSDEGGAPGSWQSHPAPQVYGNLVAFAMAPGDADRLYAAFDRAVVALAEVHVSDDGGRTWSLAAHLDLSGQRTVGPIGDSVLSVDPADPDTVYFAAGFSGLLRSTDAGRTFARLDGPRLAGALAVIPGSIAAFEVAEAVGWHSTDGGGTFAQKATGAPAHFRRAAYGLSPEALLAVQDPGEGDAPPGSPVWRHDVERDEFREITPSSRPVLRDPLHDGAGGFVVSGPDGLWTWHGDRPRASDDSTVESDRGQDAGTRILPAQPPEPSPARLDPPRSLALSPGEERTVDVRLTVPPRPRDLDLVLLFDTTNSMTGSIDALRTDAQRLVNALAASGNRTRFGVAEFQDYPIAPYGQPINRAYARLRDLAPVDASLRTALAALSTRDDLDVPTSGLTGLFQLATGAGQSGLPRTPQSEDPNIPAGQGMGFAAEAVKVVVAFGDEPFHDSPGHPGPSLGETVTALREAGALVAGVSVGGRPVGAGPDLRRVAAGTGTLAPVDVDCGDSVVPAGAPLVCDVGAGGVRLDSGAPDGRLVEAVTALVDAIPGPATATLAASAPAGLSAATGAGAPLDLRATSTAVFPVTVTCAQPVAGDVALAARVGTDVVARATLPVTCGALPAADPGPAAAAPVAPVPVVPVEPPAAALAGAPPLAPPPLVQVPAPAPAQVAAGAQAPAGAGSTAAAPGAVAGLAGAPADAARRVTQAFADGRDGVPLAAVPLGAGALATAALTTHLLATRRRPSAPVTARTRRTGEPR